MKEKEEKEKERGEKKERENKKKRKAWCYPEEVNPGKGDCKEGRMTMNVDLESIRGPLADCLNNMRRDTGFSKSSSASCTKGNLL